MIPRSRRYNVFFRYIRFDSGTEVAEDCPVPQSVIAYDAKDARDQAELIFQFGYPTFDGIQDKGANLKLWDEMGRDFVIIRIEPEDRAQTAHEYTTNRS